MEGGVEMTKSKEKKKREDGKVSLIRIKLCVIVFVLARILANKTELKRLPTTRIIYIDILKHFHIFRRFRFGIISHNEFGQMQCRKFGFHVKEVYVAATQ